MNKQKITILMADDHPVYRDGLRQIIQRDPALQILHETGDGAEVLPLVNQLMPDVAVLDIDMPGLHGLDIARERNRKQLPFEIIFVTMYREEDMVYEAMDLGVRGYVLKESAAADILEGIHAVAAGQHYLSPSLSGLLVRRSQPQTSPLQTLTPSERRILKLIATDKTSKEIADELGLSTRTVDNHRTNISTKLGLRGSHSLLKFAFENKLRI